MTSTQARAELNAELRIWKDNQEKFRRDEDFFHYSTREIQKIEERLDLLSRTLNGEG